MNDYRTAWAALASCLVLCVFVALPAAAQDRGTWTPIPDHVWQAMQGKSWHSHLPCPKRKDLALLVVPHLNFAGQRQRGEMIVARAVADELLDAFAEIHRGGFRIQRMEPIYKFGGDDNRSMNANNTSAFNCRSVTGGTRLSEHSYGMAVDINPIQNPYVRKNVALPPAGRRFASPAERLRPHPGLIRKSEIVITAFARIGWKWGGDWRSLKDYQHFSKSGR